MITFIGGLVILLVGGMLYGGLCEKIIKPSDEATPAFSLRDDVDYVPMGKWRNSLIELLNIAGTGPIIGPIQGILFGPIAFITIPIGCVIAGAFHDYMVGMISARNNGEQTPYLIKRFLGNNIYRIYNIFVSLMMLLVGVVFIYTPGDLFVTQIFAQESSPSNPTVWIVYGAIFVYYLLATLFPIDKIIGRIYPVFGAILLISAVGVFVGIFLKAYPLTELWQMTEFGYPYQTNFLPMFFVTVTCGICSGFHSTQATLVSRTISNERDGRVVFYDMMIAEGFIAMTWAAAAMGALNSGLTTSEGLLTQATVVVGVVAKDMLGPIGGLIAIIGVIVLPITSGDTALRALRLMVGDTLHIDQSKKKNALPLAICIFVIVGIILFWAKVNPTGFGTIWRYFSWANETTVVFVMSMIAVYMKKNKMPNIMAVIPATFYMYVITSYILHAQIGFNLSWVVSYIVAAVVSCGYMVLLLVKDFKN